VINEESKAAQHVLLREINVKASAKGTDCLITIRLFDEPSKVSSSIFEWLGIWSRKNERSTDLIRRARVMSEGLKTFLE